MAGLEEGEEEEEGDDDHAEFHMGESSSRATIQPRWPTRVFAAECVRRIVVACQACRNTPAHFDLAIAKEMQLTKSRGMGYRYMLYVGRQVCVFSFENLQYLQIKC